MSVLITGSSGYIGTQLCQRYEVTDGRKSVIGLDLVPPRETFSKLTFYQQDCNDDLSKVFDNHRIDTIIHLVYILNMTHDSEGMYRVNVGSLENVLGFAEKYGARRMLVTSSATAYGAHADNPDWLTEDHPLRANRDYQYAYDKTIIEEHLNEFAVKHADVEIVIARPAIVCGAHIGNFISRYISKSLVPLVKNGDVEMQFVHEDDVAEGLYCLATEAPPGVYNLGPPNTIPISRIVEIMGRKAVYLRPRFFRALTGLAWALRLSYFAEAPSSMINFLQYRWVVDGSKIEQTTSFRYKYSSADAIRDFSQAQANP